MVSRGDVEPSEEVFLAREQRAAQRDALADQREIDLEVAASLAEGRFRNFRAREMSADARDRAAETRRRIQDEREAMADERERLADLREATADRRDQASDRRERDIDQREIDHELRLTALD